MKDSLRLRADIMTEVYGQLVKKYRWRANDISLRFAACVFSLTGKNFDLEQYDKIVRHIKKNTGFFSYFRSTLLYPFAAQLICQFDQPDQAFSTLLNYDSMLKANGFKTTSYRGIAAYALLTTCSPEELEVRVRKAAEIYTRMKENHFWLTTADDYGVAVLLAAEQEDPDSLISRMEENYQRLNREGFRKSNGLQFLSHLLTFSSESVGDLTERCREIADFLASNRLKLSSMYYGAIGLLALLGQDCRSALADVVEMAEYLRENKAFKWYYKEINVLMISALVGTEYVEEKKKQEKLGAASIGIAVEALIAAQTAAMIAATSAATAAASASASAH